MPDSAAEEEVLDTELARANLARLRGDYESARSQCLHLLKLSPQNSSVAALLGDISAEQGKLDEASHWYEVAIGAGAASGISEKLDSVQARIKRSDAESAEDKLGLAKRTWLTPPVALAATVILLMLFVAAYVAGTSRTPAKQSASGEAQPILLPQSTPNPPPTGAPSQSVPSDNPPPTPTTSSKPDAPIPSASVRSIDPDLQAAISDGAGPVSRVTTAIVDPRTRSAIVDVPSEPGDDPRGLDADVAGAILSADKGLASVTVRVLSSGRPIFVADATRDRFDAYQGQDHSSANGPSLADAILSNEWKAPSDASPSDR